MNDIYTWHNDLYPLVKKRFDLRYAKRLNVINRVCDVICQDDVDYRIEGVGGYGEMPVYDGTNVMQRRSETHVYHDSDSQGARDKGYLFLQEGKARLFGRGKEDRFASCGQRIYDGAQRVL